MPKKSVKLRWTNLQREVASKVAEGANFEELVNGGYSKSLVSKVLKAIKAGQAPNSLELGSENREPRTESRKLTSKVSQSLPRGEAIGSIDETKQIKKEATTSPKTEGKQETSIEEAKPEESLKPEEATLEKPKRPDEGIGIVSEAVAPKGKDGKPEELEKKIATTIADDGIKCIVFLSLQTLALYKIAASTQAQIDGDEELSLGDFLDTCAEDFFRVRGKKLGLISSGGK